jgi:DNA-directed RNA polymerase subunit L
MVDSMKVEILEKTNDSILLEIHGERHGFANLLRMALLKHKNTLDAAYFIKHPDLDPPRVYLKTDGKKSAMKVLKATVKQLASEIVSLQDTFQKSIEQVSPANN